MLRKFLLVALALTPLTASAYDEIALTTPGFDLRAGGSWGAGLDKTKEENDIIREYKGFHNGGFLDAGYRFHHYGLYASFQLNYLQLNDDGRVYDNAISGGFFINNRWFIPIKQKLAFVPHLGVGFFNDGIGGKAGFGFDYMLDSNFYITGEVSYIGTENIEAYNSWMQGQFGFGYHF